MALVCMFDVGNAIMCFGITFLDCDGDFQGERERQGDFADAFFLYAVCDLFGDDFALCGAIHLPQPVYTVAGMIGQANSFLAMLLIGILFEPKINRSERKDMAGVFLLRMALGIAFSLLIYHFLPIPLRYRQVLAIIVFSPILSVAPIYTERCGYNRSVAAVLNSLMLPFSMVVMTILLMLLKVY